METSQVPHVDVNPKPQQGRTFESLTQAERQSFVADAIAEKDKFVSWATKQDATASKNSHVDVKTKIVDKWKQMPSKKLTLASLSAVGLANVGMTLAAEKFGLSSNDIKLYWLASFGFPIVKELVFRSKAIPNFISLVGEKIGMPVRPDKARLATNALFGLLHLPNAPGAKSILAGVNAFAGGAGSMQKISNERGMAASIALHSVWNATMMATTYLVEGSHFYRHHKIGDPPIVKSLLNDDQKYAMVSNIHTITQLGAVVGMGIMGVKEMIADKQINELLERLKKTSVGNDLVNSKQVVDVAQKLLKNPSVDGYKFEAGVELAYVNAALNMPETLKDVMTPDDYARTQVHKTVTEVWNDSSTLPHRLEKANAYITKELAKRTKSTHDKYTYI